MNDPFYRTYAAGAVFGMTMFLRLLTTGTLAAALGPAATAAAQPTIDPLKPCYVAAQPGQTESVAIAAHGFMPFAKIDVYVDGVLQSPPAGAPAPQADAAGDLIGAVPAPYIPFGAQRFTLRLSEEDASGNTASTFSWVTALAVEQVPPQARTRARVRFRGRGFTDPGPIYAHYVYKDRSRRTVRIARKHGACGAFSRKRRQFPFRHSPRVGTWTIQFDQERHYTESPDVSARLTVKVNRAIRPKHRRSK